MKPRQGTESFGSVTEKPGKTRKVLKYIKMGHDPENVWRIKTKTRKKPGSQNPEKTRKQKPGKNPEAKTQKKPGSQNLEKTRKPNPKSW